MGSTCGCQEACHAGGWVNGAKIKGISERLMEVRLELKGKSIAVIFVAAFATTETAGEVDKKEFGTGWHSATLHGPPGEHPF